MFNKLSSHFLEIVLNMQKLHTHTYIYMYRDSHPTYVLIWLIFPLIPKSTWLKLYEVMVIHDD
jgi:hypothetical protein